MRERLIKMCENLILSCKSSLCADCEHNKIDYPDCMSAHFADYLLDNGVIVPPCKVGDKVYVIFKNEIYKATVFSMKIETEDDHYLTLIKVNVFDKISMFKVFIFGKTVFLTREEAEKALQEVKGK